MQQVITIGADGHIAGLQRKPGQGLDLRQFGKATIERASEIVWAEGSQKWFVSVLTGPFAGRFLSDSLWHDHVCDLIPAEATVEFGKLMFDEYDDAVRAEIEFLDGLRMAGRLG